MLTVIIPFLNEGIEIRNTVQSIRQTVGNRVDIILVNDASEDGYDYLSIAKQYDTAYIENKQRIGAAQSREIGINSINTDYFITIDGHMRFYQENWYYRIIEELKNNERAIYCCDCLRLDGMGQIKNKISSYGAYIELDDMTEKGILNPQWIKKDILPGEIKQVPCVLGASYCASKHYWDYIKGLSGLKMYGVEEPYISIKTWLEGGQCLLISDVKVGHIFRNEFPYFVDDSIYIYNKLLIAETLFPKEYKDKVYNALRYTSGNFITKAMVTLSKEYEIIKQLREYYRKISNRTFDSFVQFNNNIKKQIDVC